MQPPVSHSSRQPLHQPRVRSRITKFQAGMASLQVSTCVTCMERFPGMTVRETSAGTECVRSSRDKNSPKAYSCSNNMHPGPVPQELQVYNVILWPINFVASFTPLICYSHSAGADSGGGDAYLCSDAYHVHLQTAPGTVWLHWTCGQPATECLPPLPRVCQDFHLTWIYIIIVRREGAHQTHRDFRVRGQVVQRALQWLVTHNQYYCSMGITIDTTALEQLPQDGNVTHLVSSTNDCSTPTETVPPTGDGSELDDDHLSHSFVPVSTPSMTE